MGCEHPDFLARSGSPYVNIEKPRQLVPSSPRVKHRGFHQILSDGGPGLTVSVERFRIHPGPRALLKETGTVGQPVIVGSREFVAVLIERNVARALGQVLERVHHDWPFLSDWALNE